jgi:hypothetical protein
MSCNGRIREEEKFKKNKTNKWRRKREGNSEKCQYINDLLM